MSPSSALKQASDCASWVRDCSIAQPASTHTSPSSVVMAYTLTARRSSSGRGSGVRCTPGATS